jgi:hypothetical protein
MCHVTTILNITRRCLVCLDTGVVYPRVETSDEGITFRLGVACPACTGKPLNKAGAM